MTEADVRDSNYVSSSAEIRMIAWYAPALAVCIVAIFVTPHWLSPTNVNDDVSWLFILAQRLLDGARPYVDFLEVNPPLSILLYLPAVAFGNWSGISPAYVLLAMMFAGAFISTYATIRIARSATLLSDREIPIFAALLLVLFLILPGSEFAEREHITAIAILPMLAVYAARAGRSPPSLATAIGAGICAGVAVCVKPHFLFALLFPIAYVIGSSFRNWRAAIGILFAPENIVAALVGVTYLAIVFLYFPAFIHDTLPFDMTVYVPFRLGFTQLLLNPAMLLLSSAIILMIGLSWRGKREPLPAIFVFSAFGFSLAFFIQGRGYIYQGYPQLAFSALAVGTLLILRLPKMLFGSGSSARRIETGIAAISALFFLGLLAAQFTWLNTQRDWSRVLAAIERNAPPHPRIATLSSQLDVGQIPVRRLNGFWIGTACCSWLGETQGMLKHWADNPDARARVMAYDRYDEEMVSRDIRTGHPDVILIDAVGEKAAALSHAKVAAALSQYHKVDKADDIEIWVPKRRPVPGQLPH